MSPEDVNFEGETMPLDGVDETDDTESRVVPSKKIRTFGNASGLGARRGEGEFKRSLNKTGQGATRVHTFHARLSDSGLNFLDEQINDWLEKNPDIEIKFSNTTVGVLEAKRSEPNLIVTVWY